MTKTRRAEPRGKIVAFSGSRDYKNWSFVLSTLERIRPDFIKVGDCPTGLDLFIHMFAHALKIDHEIFEANWEGHGKTAGPRRNIRMIDSGVNFLVAYPENNSKGTKQCSEYAHSVNVPVYFPEWHMWELVDYATGSARNTWFLWAEKIIEEQGFRFEW